ncbi:MAG: energy transducer TonB [Cytophagaceae bacterium]
MKILIQLLLVISFLGMHDRLCAQNTKPAREDLPYGTPPPKRVDIKRPEFVLGDETNDSITKYLQSKLVYPEEACLNNITGRIYLQYRVDTTGAIKDCKLLLRKDNEQDREVLEKSVLDMFVDIPAYATPGLVDRVPSNIYFTVIVDFLSNDTCKVSVVKLSPYSY